MNVFQVLIVQLAFAQFSEASMLTLAPDLNRRQAGSGFASCASVTNLESACGTATPGFSDLSPSVKASCLCYTSSTWAPSIFEGYWGGCLAYLKTEAPTVYTSLGGDSLPLTWCTSARGAEASASTTASGSVNPLTTSAPSGGTTPDAYFAACETWYALVNSCAAETTSFTDLDFSSQAPCVCGATSSPFAYDQFWGSCLLYERTAAPEKWSSAGGDSVVTTPCASLARAGGLSTSTTPTMTSTTPRPATTTTAGPSTTSSTGGAGANARPMSASMTFALVLALTYAVLAV